MIPKPSPLTVLFLAFLIGAPIAAHAAEPTLTVVDNTGERHVLNSPRIDYTRVDGILYTPDFESAGVRILKGKAQITLSWSKIARLEITDSVKLAAKVLLQSGRESDLQLVRDSKEGLTGSSDLGQVSLRLADIKSIEVTAAKASGKAKK